jgi:hypothetical protein
MTHARQKIRDRIVELLEPISEVTVVNSRAYPMIALPVISVYTLNESSQSENLTIGAPRRYSRVLAVAITIAVSESDQADEMADVYAGQVEQKMAADVTLGGFVTDSTLTQTDTEIDGGSEKPIFITRLVYEIWYRTTADDPGTVI